MIRAKVCEWIERHGLLPWGGNVVAACSGGADSLALVDLLEEYHCAGAIRLVIAHFDHGLRGEASARDAEFVRLFCLERDLPFFADFADVKAACPSGESLEETARCLRYGFLHRILTQVGGGLIATGHHKDDQAETMLLNLLRGSGGRGLAAMQPRRGDIIRPLLCLTRAEIVAYCQARHLQPCNDESNGDVAYYRNRVRHELVPLLEQRFTPALKETLCRTAEVLADEQAFLREYVMERLPDLVVFQESNCHIDAAVFAGLKTAVQRELLRVLLERLRGDTRGIGFVHIEQMRQLFLQQQGAKRIDLPGAWQARKSYHDLYIEAAPGFDCVDRETGDQEPDNVRLACPGETWLPEFGVSLRCSVIPSDLLLPEALGPDKVAFDCAVVTPPLYVRRRAPGDLFQPLGTAGRRKLKKLLIDLKVPVEQRERIPLVFDAQGILWIAGLRRSERGRLQASTREILIVEQIKAASAG